MSIVSSIKLQKYATLSAFCIQTWGGFLFSRNRQVQIDSCTFKRKMSRVKKRVSWVYFLQLVNNTIIDWMNAHAVLHLHCIIMRHHIAIKFVMHLWCCMMMPWITHWLHQIINWKQQCPSIQSWRHHL